MQQKREVSPLVLNGLKALERELDKFYRGRSFIYLPALHLQSECYCHLIRKYIVIGISPPAENMFLKRHISLKDSLATIVKKLNLYREYRSQSRCDFCCFFNNLKEDERRIFSILSKTNNYRMAANELNINEKNLRRKIYTFTQKMNIQNRRWFLWWINYMCRRRPHFFNVSAD